MTSRQASLLKFIQAYTGSNGFAPSFEEMRAHLGIGSKSGVDRLVRALEERRVSDLTQFSLLQSIADRVGKREKVRA